MTNRRNQIHPLHFPKSPFYPSPDVEFGNATQDKEIENSTRLMTKNLAVAVGFFFFFEFFQFFFSPPPSKAYFKSLRSGGGVGSKWSSVR